MNPTSGQPRIQALEPLERPAAPIATQEAFGSDVVASTLRALGMPFIALNPGASFRGLHDSLVNLLGNERPQILLCLHEEHAVAIAHGYAKVTGRAMAVALHSNVGLFHATMAIFNAWCDRVPIVILGATGPVDAVRRRPWIDWIHTSRDQGAIVRQYVKWDDQPASPAAAREALLRGAWLAQTPPMAPVYINLDAQMQEARLDAPLPPCDTLRHAPNAAPAAPTESIREAAAMLRSARRPLVLVGRVSRSVDAWQARIRLVERLGAGVLTDLKVGAAFPTEHPRHIAAPGLLLNAQAVDALREADVVLSLDWVDLGGTLASAIGSTPKAKVIHASVDHVLHNGWSMDHQAMPPVDLWLPAAPDAVVPALVDVLHDTTPSNWVTRTVPSSDAEPRADGDAIDVDDLARALREAVGARATSLAHLPLSWNGATWPFAHPLDYVGSDGGAGIGAGPGIAVGAALALRGTGRLPIAVCGDGDFLMGVTALWTAVHYRIPLLVVVANNASFYNDEVHQERVARDRARPIENKWIGQRIADPYVDLAAMAEAQGAIGIGPIAARGVLASALDEAVAVVDAGRVAVVDVRVRPGNTPAMMSASRTR